MKKGDEKMKKSDLKNFDVVRLRNGEEYIVVKEMDLLARVRYTLRLGEFKEDLTSFVEENRDIVAVRRAINDLSKVPLFWEREEKVELTQDERVVLEHLLNRGYIFIARDRDNDLCFFVSKPFKFRNKFWTSDDPRYVRIPTFWNDVFQFVTWEQEEALSVEELLKNESMER